MRTAMLRLIAVASVALVSGCYSSTRIDSLALENGDIVPVRFSQSLVVRDIASGKPVEGARVFLGNDEDPIDQVAWTDADGRAIVSQEYSEHTVKVETRHSFFMTTAEATEIRYPAFELLVTRAGYEPVYVRAGLQSALAPKSGTPQFAEAHAPLVLERYEPLSVSLTARGDGALSRVPPPSFEAAPQVGQLKLGARGPVNRGRFLRLGAADGEPLIACCARLWRREAGDAGRPAEVLLVGTVNAAERGFYERAALLASTFDTVIRSPDLRGGPVTAALPTGTATPARRDAITFIEDCEHAPVGDLAPLEKQLDDALQAGKRTAILAPVAQVKALEAELDKRKLRRIAETWIPAWIGS